MKTIVFKIVIVCILFVFFAFACRKTETLSIGPTLEFVANTGFISSDTAWATGDTAIIALKCIWDGSDFVRSIYTYYNGDKIGEPIEVNKVYGEEFIYKLKITKSIYYVETWSFEVADVKGHLSKIDLLIRADESGGDISSVNADLGVQSNIKGSYFSFNDGMNHREDYALINQDAIHMVAGYDFFAYSFLSSPACNNTYDIYDFSAWSIRNLTQFCPTTISPNQYLLTNKDNLLISSFHQDKAVDIISNLEVNSIYSFRAPDGRYGLLKIVSKATGDNGTIGFDYKIQATP